MFPNLVRRVRFALTICFVAVSMSACLVPENFQTTINLNDDGSYNFKYRGQLAFVPAVIDAAQGKLTEKAENDLRDLVPELKRDFKAQSVRYAKDGRYTVAITDRNITAEKYHFPAEKDWVLRILRDSAGKFTVEVRKLGTKERDDLKSIGIKLAGSLKVSHGGAYRAEEHNSTVKPTVLGIRYDYLWSVDPESPSPRIVIVPQG